VSVNPSATRIGFVCPKLAETIARSHFRRCSHVLTAADTSWVYDGFAPVLNELWIDDNTPIEAEVG
jgi:hypothetical protein